LVMQGKSPSARSSEFDYLKIVDQVDAKTVDYDPAIFGGELGPYEPA
jgi:branched-chain amino acid transport system substrate-binding protein